MRYWLDTEFLERPCTIELVSIGIVAEDGRELYAESNDVDWTLANQWVMENVKPHLSGPTMSRADIRDNVLWFIGDDESPEFWGDYSDYDWVVFCWLFGTMMDLPRGFPMFCRDLQQFVVEHFDPDMELPEQPSGLHNALSDARWTRDVHLWLDGGPHPLEDAAASAPTRPSDSADGETARFTTEEPR